MPPPGPTISRHEGRPDRRNSRRRGADRRGAFVALRQANLSLAPRQPPAGPAPPLARPARGHLPQGARRGPFPPALRIPSSRSHTTPARTCADMSSSLQSISSTRSRCGRMPTSPTSPCRPATSGWKPETARCLRRSGRGPKIADRRAPCHPQAPGHLRLPRRLRGLDWKVAEAAWRNLSAAAVGRLVFNARTPGRGKPRRALRENRVRNQP